MQFDPKDSDSYSRLISPTFGYHVKEKFKDKVAECKAKGESYGFKPLNAAATQFFSNIQTQVAIKWERIKCYFDKELRGEVRHFNDERIMKLIRAKIVNFDNKVNGRDILSLEDELELMNLMRTCEQLKNKGGAVSLKVNRLEEFIKTTLLKSEVLRLHDKPEDLLFPPTIILEDESRKEEDVLAKSVKKWRHEYKGTYCSSWQAAEKAFPALKRGDYLLYENKNPDGTVSDIVLFERKLPNGKRDYRMFNRNTLTDDINAHILRGEHFAKVKTQEFKFPEAPESLTMENRRVVADAEEARKSLEINAKERKKHFALERICVWQEKDGQLGIMIKAGNSVGQTTIIRGENLDEKLSSFFRINAQVGVVENRIQLLNESLLRCEVGEREFQKLKRICDGFQGLIAEDQLVRLRDCIEILEATNAARSLSDLKGKTFWGFRVIRSDEQERAALSMIGENTVPYVLCFNYDETTRDKFPYKLNVKLSDGSFDTFLANDIDQILDRLQKWSEIDFNPARRPE